MAEAQDDGPPPPAEVPPSAAQPSVDDVPPPPPVSEPAPVPADRGEAAPSAAAGAAAPASEVAANQAAAEAAAADAPTAPAAGEAASSPTAAAGEGAAATAATAHAGAAVKAEEGRAAADVKDEAVVTHEAAGGPALAAPEPPSDEVLVARLRQLLTEVDLATTTEKQLRRRLEDEYGVDLAGRKKLLRSEINAYLEAAEGDQDSAGEAEGKEEEQEEEEEEEEEAPSGRKRRAGGSSLGSFLSPEMQDFLGVERLPRTQVVKRLWEYIKEHGLQDPKDKRTIIFDDKLKTLFTGTKCNMFKLQKHLSKHCKTSDVVGGSDDDEGSEEEGEDDDDEEEEERPPAKKARKAPAPRAASRKRGSSAGEEGRERKPNGFTKECTLSAEMAAWIGKPTASRPEITKFFWAYCKERGLQDPADKSFIVADGALKGLTGEARFKGFGFSKLIKEHITGYT
ncbi:hypothetical protein CHLNCDRAFT_49597 [Chlorella variabilis]|uniref:DM2 domain-containing protein n=1 Tax=Chlorella variabilis TaxID=554065 RepID=E1Z334_CHLVA|nr:hypothetical protein CHLNCDRAFT_49597 [Chlorella variabilis]EFN60104.1 hypothetical protein CHLNCDRAFT_49597 [Chlorella variabilis]|eukprot:XP_005852206.1 hypothetical protein CHLNCDRAFT_49597 [Chlorella variabilis]